MQGVISEAESAGVAQLELFVDTENHRAVTCYEKHGFQRIATHRDGVRINGQSRDDYFMPCVWKDESRPTEDAA